MAGSIEKRGKNSYRLTVSEGFDLNGNPMIHRKTVHGTKKDAEVELAKFVTEVQNGLVVDGKSLKFSEFTEIWKRDYGSKELAPSTYKRYCRMLETRLLPYFGHFYINKIRPTDIMKFYDLLEKDTQLVRKKGNNGTKTKKPLSGKTILEHHRLLRAMLHRAVYWQLIVSNPAERVQAPRAKKPKRRSYDDEQTKILLENLEQLSIEDTKYKVAIILTVFTGVRLGELMGLEWQDIDFKNGIISIIVLVSIYQIWESLQKFQKQKVPLERLQYPNLSFLYLRNISYGMKNKNRFITNCGTILIGYLYKQMANQCILLPLANGL